MSASACLVMDIGATNARFSLIDLDAEVDLAPQRVVVLPTQDLAVGAGLVPMAREVLGVDQFDAACIAMAGPVVDGVGRITNGRLGLQQTQLAAELNCPVWLVNDFFALAHGVPRFTKLVQIGGSAPSASSAGGTQETQELEEGGVKAVIGAGSGLGMSALVATPLGSSGSQWRVLPSEGGHADLACSNELEVAVLQVLLQKFEHVCWETVLSGPGLVHLYEALAEVWGYPTEGGPDDVDLDADSGVDPGGVGPTTQKTRQETTPEWICEQGIDAQVPLCHQTLELFFGFLGAAAGNLALTVYATGGVYIGGGIVPRLELFARTSPLRRRFEERGRMRDVIEKIPLYLIAEQNPGLLGAAALLERQLGYSSPLSFGSD